jgi:hypothetical protein
MKLVSEDHDRFCVEFRCKDTGIGMKQDALDRVFSPFHTAHSMTDVASTGNKKKIFFLTPFFRIRIEYCKKYCRINGRKSICRK